MQMDTRLCYFNSYVVRLKVEAIRIECGSERHFNSYVVRLKARKMANLFCLSAISIPMWYD